MKKLLALLLILLPTFAFAQVTLPQGGLGTTTVPQFYVLLGGPSTLRVTASATSSLGLPTFSGNNTWTGLNIFSNASTSLLTVSTNTWFPYLGTAAGTILAVDPAGKLIATSTSAGGVTSVTGVYPVQSTGGNTPAISLAFGTTTANTWSLLQNFSNATSTLFSATTAWIGTLNLTNPLTVPNGGTASTTLGGILTGNGTSAVTSATVSAPLTFGSNTLACATCLTTSFWPWTIATNFATTTNSTTTPTWYKTGVYASSTSQFDNATTSLLTVTNNTWLTSLATAAGTILAVDPAGKVIATTTSQGTVTSITAGTGLNGGTITTTGTISQKSYLATSSAETAGQLAYWTSSAGTPATLGTVATGTLAATGPITVTAGQSVIGSGATIACATCNTSSLSGTGVNGMMTAWSGANSLIATSTVMGGIFIATTTGNATSTFAGNVAITGNLQVSGNFFAPVSLVAGGNLNMATFSITNVGGLTGTFITALVNGGTATSTWNNTGGIAYYNGTTLTNTGTFTFTKAGELLTVTNASTTALSATGYLQVPVTTGASTTLPAVSGSVGVNTTQASSSIRYYDGTAARTLFASQPKSLVLASSTLAYFGVTTSATTTLNVMNSVYQSTITRYFCKTSAGTVNIQFGNGTATSTMLVCSTTGVDTGVLSSNNQFNMFQNIYLDVGDMSSTVGYVTVTAMVRSDPN